MGNLTFKRVCKLQGMLGQYFFQFAHSGEFCIHSIKTEISLLAATYHLTNNQVLYFQPLFSFN